VIAMVILTPIAMLILLMALARLEAALLPDGDDGPGSSTGASEGEQGPGRQRMCRATPSTLPGQSSLPGWSTSVIAVGVVVAHDDARIESGGRGSRTCNTPRLPEDWMLPEDGRRPDEGASIRLLG
jgi:hypothetical protein